MLTIVVCVSVFGFVSFWLTRRVFQFWFSFICFVTGLCWIRFASARKVIACWNLPCEICGFLLFHLCYAACASHLFRCVLSWVFRVDIRLFAGFDLRRRFKVYCM